MKLCAYCQKEYANKRDTSRFCSDKCRVAYNRKNPKKGDAITPVQMQVLYNSVLEMVGKFEPTSFKGISATQNGTPTAASNTTNDALKPRKSMVQYFEAKRECQCDEEWVKLCSEIDSDPYLTYKQKQLLKTTHQ